MDKKYEGWCRTGAYATILINNAYELTKEQMLQVLRTIRADIAAGRALDYEDSTEIGNKCTTCTWGMCSEDPKHAPDARLHNFPKDFDVSGRMSLLDNPPGHHCPMRDTQGKRYPAFGCFHECRVFQRSKETPTREEALELYDKAIARLEEEL